MAITTLSNCTDVKTSAGSKHRLVSLRKSGCDSGCSNDLLRGVNVCVCVGGGGEHIKGKAKQIVMLTEEKNNNQKNTEEISPLS